MFVPCINPTTCDEILMCYVFSVVSYGCETWTYSKAIDHKTMLISGCNNECMNECDNVPFMHDSQIQEL